MIPTGWSPGTPLLFHEKRTIGTSFKMTFLPRGKSATEDALGCGKWSLNHGDFETSITRRGCEDVNIVSDER
jgi:hypothetical protein